MAADDNELAQTATAAASKDLPALAGTLGRYKLERLLGAGGMGVVHAAYDADLERRVALKVLRDDAGNQEARQRLLREARAMARLAHPNVVVVHEVGSANGRDYVAMELVDGETLADWLRAAPRDPHDIVAAFVAAGRGLAAAHAAGLVHRDFKPHNVLRRRDGRLLVTDFGLARGVETALALETTMQASATSTSTPSSLSGLTATGSVLGTPAYMSPEQWAGGTVGPAADQFAFCVALWEALAGERPYRGTTVEELRKEVGLGPAALDASKLPRRLRKVLRRGLDPDADKRWPSMDTLLAHLTRADHRTRYVLAGVAAIAAGVTVLALSHGGGVAAVVCPDPIPTADAAWPASASPAWKANGRALVAEAVDRDVSAWTAARAQACTAPAAHHDELACLDGVMARIDILRQAVERIHGKINEDALAWLVDPNVCAKGPRLKLAPTADTVTALAFQLDPDVPASTGFTFVGKPGLDACPKAIALYAIAEVSTDVEAKRTLMTQTTTAAEQCGDERLIADYLLADAPLHAEAPVLGPRGIAAIDRAKSAAAKVPQADIRADVAMQDLSIAYAAGKWDAGIAAADLAIAGYGERHRVAAQIDAVSGKQALRFGRNASGDFEAVVADVEKWKPIGASAGASTRGLETWDAYARLFLNDPSAHDLCWRVIRPLKHTDGQRIEGVVVDAAGRPVAGAEVGAASELMSDSRGVFPFGRVIDLRVAKSGADGTFVITDASDHGAIVAQLGALRSAPAKIAGKVRLQLAPTRHVDGKVALGGTPRTRAFVLVHPATEQYSIVAMLDPDGSFSLDGAPQTSFRIGPATWDFSGNANSHYQDIPAGTEPIHGLQLALVTTTRSLDVIARGQTEAPLSAAVVFVAATHAPIANLDELFSHHEAGVQTGTAQPVGARPPLAKAKKGDATIHFENVAPGPLTVCAIGLTTEMNEHELEFMYTHDTRMASHCVAVSASDDVVVVETPPQKRMD